MKKTIALVSLGCLWAVSLRAAAPLSVRFDNGNGLYDCGKGVCAQIAYRPTEKSPAGNLEIEIRTVPENETLVQTNVVVSTRPVGLSLNVSRATPGVIICTVRSPGEKKPAVRAALVGLGQFKPAAPRPADFDAVWDRKAAQLAQKVPLDAKVVARADARRSGRRVFDVSFATFGGKRVTGVLSLPKDAKGAPCPVHVNVPDQGVAATSVYEQLDGNRFREDEIYFILDAPETVTPGAILGMSRAVDWVAQHKEANADDITYAGKGRGASYGYYLLGVNRRFRRGVVFAAVEQPVADAAQAPYFDIAHFAPRIQVPFNVSFSFAPTTASPIVNAAAYDALGTKHKKLYPVSEIGGYAHGLYGLYFGVGLKFLRTPEVLPCKLVFHIKNPDPDLRAFCKTGETVPFEVLATDEKGVPIRTKRLVKASIDNYGNTKGVKCFLQTNIDLSVSNPFVVSAKRDTPGMLHLRLSAEETPDRDYAVACDPFKIRGVAEEPADFDAFWRKAIADYDRTVPKDIRLERIAERCKPEYDFYRLHLTSVGGKKSNGILTVPTGAKTGRKYPLFVHSPGAGISACRSTVGRADVVKLWFSVHSFVLPFDEEGARAAEAKLHADLKAAYNYELYSICGASVSPAEFYYHPSYLAALRAIDWLCEQPYVDTSCVFYKSGSQGGSFGMFMLAMSKRFTHGVLHVPSFCDTAGYRAGRISPAPSIPYHSAEAGWNVDTVTRSISYYDGCFLAKRITCPVIFTVGLIDTACPCEGVLSAYNVLGSREKHILPMAGYGHWGNRWYENALEKWLLTRELPDERKLYEQTEAYTRARCPIKK